MIDFIHHLKKPNMKKILFAILCAAAVLLGCNTGNSGNNKPVGTEETTAENTTSIQKCIHLDTGAFNEKVFNINADAEIYLGDKPAIIDFYADRCGPCRQLAPTLESIAANYSGKIYVYKVNVDNSPELAQHFNITRIPTVMFVSAEGETNTTLGVMDQREFESKITEFLGVR